VPGEAAEVGGAGEVAPWPSVAAEVLPDYRDGVFFSGAVPPEFPHQWAKPVHCGVMTATKSPPLGGSGRWRAAFATMRHVVR
jgi:hypothetical protein